MLLLLTLLPLLGACGLIPEQTFTDPLPLRGEPVRLTVGAADPLSLQAIGVAEIVRTFDDQEGNTIPIGPNSGLLKAGFQTEATLEMPGALVPCEIVITQMSAVITVSDASGTTTLPPLQLNKRIDLEQDPVQLERFRLVTDDAFVAAVIERPELQALQGILAGGGVNEVRVRIRAQITSVPDLPPGSAVILTFDVSEATVAF